MTLSSAILLLVPSDSLGQSIIWESAYQVKVKVIETHYIISPSVFYWSLSFVINVLNMLNY